MDEKNIYKPDEKRITELRESQISYLKYAGEYAEQGEWINVASSLGEVEEIDLIMAEHLDRQYDLSLKAYELSLYQCIPRLKDIYEKFRGAIERGDSQEIQSFWLAMVSDLAHHLYKIAFDISEMNINSPLHKSAIDIIKTALQIATDSPDKELHELKGKAKVGDGVVWKWDPNILSGLVEKIEKFLNEAPDISEEEFHRMEEEAKKEIDQKLQELQSG